MVMIRKTPLVNGEIYHVYNRGVEKRTITINSRDHERFFESLDHYRFENPGRLSNFKDFGLTEERNRKETIVDIIGFCLMPNHFHLLLRQLTEKGVSIFMSNLINSYTRYFNVKHNRIGPLFQGGFKSVHIENDEQLIHLSRYIHLNPVEARLVSREKFMLYPYSSLLNTLQERFCNFDVILKYFNNNLNEYLKFCSDYTNYKYSIAGISDKLLD